MAIVGGIIQAKRDKALTEKIPKDIPGQFGVVGMDPLTSERTLDLFASSGGEHLADAGDKVRKLRWFVVNPDAFEKDLDHDFPDFFVAVLRKIVRSHTSVSVT
jgi:hypothetical protein